MVMKNRARMLRIISQLATKKCSKGLFFFPKSRIKNRVRLCFSGNRMLQYLSYDALIS